MKSKSRIKIKLPAITTRAEAEQMMTFLASSANTKRQIIADLDEKILRLKKEREADIHGLDEEIDLFSNELRAWAEANPAEFPKDRKSIEFLSGTLGFRTGTPKLALLSRAWNWEKVLERAEILIPSFIRNKPELDKESILNQRDEVVLQLAIKECGLKVVHDESFYIEPKLTK